MALMTTGLYRPSPPLTPEQIAAIGAAAPVGYRGIEPYWWRPQYYNPNGLPVRAVSPAAPTKIEITVKSPEPIPAATAPVVTTASWFDQEMISGVKNSYLAIGGALAAVFLWGHKR